MPATRSRPINTGEPSRQPPERREGPWLWFGVLGGPGAWAIDRLVVLYVALQGCHGTRHAFSMFGLSTMQTVAVLAMLVTALTALAAAFVSGRIWRDTRGWEQGTGAGTLRSTPFWALGGFVLSLVFFLAILLMNVVTLPFAPAC